ncbi:MAG: phosphodiester glycosidase family protein [Oscillospiraceae bacterium]|jgi:exopolysaccharide biosynthesis protein|nr:phosphodiester glycosidase family protein [Oscillospiraceae bacterium]MCI9586380.1 phosphodiester glycosidase family protein [Oscillospiraceae bacterium]
MQDERVETAAVSTGGRRVQPKEPRRHDEGGGKRPGAGRILLRIGAVLLTFVAALALTLLISLKMVCSSAFPSAQQMFVTTILETGQLKFLASWFLSSEEIQEIVDKNSMKALNASVDTALIQVGGSGSVNVGGESGEEDSGDPIEIVEVAGANYTGTMMIVKDPARVSLATIYPWREVGVPLDQLVASAGAIGGINGGLYNSYNNSGGRPYGVIVSHGEIQYNKPQEFPGLVLIGFTEDNILEIIDISKLNAAGVEELVAERRIRDAVTFQEEASDANNHFVQLIINNEAREMNGMGSGLNPRTAIGQRADGAVLLFVTDGRGKAGHLGASSGDLIGVMQEFGAVNAANLDGGSSSCMYYDGEYLMDSVTFYQANSSWKLPAGFVVT